MNPHDYNQVTPPPVIESMPDWWTEDLYRRQNAEFNRKHYGIQAYGGSSDPGLRTIERVFGWLALVTCVFAWPLGLFFLSCWLWCRINRR